MSNSSRPSARYEFRAFFAPAVAPPLTLPEFEPLEPEERTDTYLLPPDRPDVLPKLRGGTRFEVKQRLEGAEPPLERWMLAVSSGFPLDGEAIRMSTDLFHVKGEADSGAGVGPDALVEAVRGAVTGLLIAAVTKRRERFRRGDLVAERTALSVAGRAFVSIGFEAEDASDLVDVLRETGLLGAENLDYGRFLRATCRP